MKHVSARIPRLGPVRLTIKEGRISEIVSADPVAAKDDSWLSPGFIDLQINGFAGVDFSDRHLEPEQAIAIVPPLWLTGVTSFYPTLVTNSREQLARNFRILELARRSSADFDRCAPGYHLEGPYFPAGPARGVHGAEYLRSPDWNEFIYLQNAAGGNIRIITLAPEVPGAIEFIRRCATSGVLCAIGHTEADADQIHAAVKAGARLSTHLGNGCANLLERHRNPLWPQLVNDSLHASLICDTFHLPPDLIKVVVRAKGIARCILVTDAIHVAMLRPGSYVLVDTPVELLTNGKVIKADCGSMAGSTLTMNRAISVFERVGGVTLDQALYAATTAPALLLNRPGVCARLTPGAPADIARFRRGPESLEVIDVWSDGEHVVSSGRLTRPA